MNTSPTHRFRLLIAGLLVSTLPALSASADELAVRTDPRIDIERVEPERAALDLVHERSRIQAEAAQLTAPEIVALARELASLADTLLLLTKSQEPFFDLLGEDAAGLFPDPGGYGNSGGARQDGLAEDAPPSGWDFSGLAHSHQVLYLDHTDPLAATLDPDADTPGTSDHRFTSGTSGADTIVSHFWRQGNDDHAYVTLFGPKHAVWSQYRVNGRTVALVQGPVYRGPDHAGEMVNWPNKPGSDGKKPTPEAVDKPEKPVKPKPAKNPGDDLTAAQRAWANWLWKQHNLGRHGPGAVVLGPNRTNPGDPDYAGAHIPVPTLWAVLADIDLAGQPNPVGEIATDRVPSERAWRMMQQILLGEARGATPGTRPPPPGS